MRERNHHWIPMTVLLLLPLKTRRTGQESVKHAPKVTQVGVHSQLQVLVSLMGKPRHFLVCFVFVLLILAHEYFFPLIF